MSVILVAVGVFVLLFVLGLIAMKIESLKDDRKNPKNDDTPHD